MMRRIITVAILAITGSALTASAQTGTSLAVDGISVDKAAATKASKRARSQTAIRLLRKPVESVDWLDTPFEEVIRWLKNEGENAVNVVPRWAPLGVESVDRDTLVSLQLNNTTVGEVLIEVLDHISPDGEMRFRAFGNTLKISTRADFDRKMYVRVYDVTDIMLRTPDFGRSAPNIDLQQQGQGGGAGGGGGGQSVFQGGSQGGESESGQEEQEMEARLTELSTMIQRTIEPSSWNLGNAGGRGTIEVFNRSLIVYNTIEVHEQIGGPFSFTR